MNNQKEKSIKAARAFEFYVKNVWPWHRVFVKNRFSKRCKNCAASDKMLPLNSENLCAECAAGKKIPNKNL